MSKKALQDKLRSYIERAGVEYKVDGRWGVSRLQTEIDEFKARSSTNDIKRFETELIRFRESPINESTFNTDGIGSSDVIKSITKTLGDLKLRVKIDNSYYTLSQAFLERLREVQEDMENGAGGSDQDFKIKLSDVGSITIEKPLDDMDINKNDVYFGDLKTSPKERPNGSFFPYQNFHAYPLDDLQIYNDLDKMAEGTKVNCLIYALQVGGMSQNKISKLIQISKTRHVPEKDIKNICAELFVSITLHKLRIKDGKPAVRKVKYGANEKDKFNICLFCNHYFINKTLNITKYAFLNSLEQESWCVVDKKGAKRKDRFISSLDAVRMLVENKDDKEHPLYQMIKPLSLTNQIYKTTHYEQVEGVFSDIGYQHKDIKRVNSDPKYIINDKGQEHFDIFDEVGEYKDGWDEKKEKRLLKTKDKQQTILNKPIIFFDFETIPDSIHSEFLVCYVENKPRSGSSSSEINSFIGIEDCGYRMFDSLISKGYDDVLMYAHNADYDFRFIIRYLRNVKILRNGGKLLSLNGLYLTKSGKKLIVEVRCSYNLITSPLRDFGKMFQLKTQKEIMPYSMLTHENINKRFVNIDEFGKCHELSDPFVYKEFINNCNMWNLIVDNKIDFIGYNIKYCHMDCVVLKQGFNTFSKWMLEATNINIKLVLTIPSLVHKYFIQEGCYEGVYSLSSVPRAYIQKTIVGGRCMLAKNQKVIVNGSIGDEDANGLYPSAMEEMEGFLKGKPHVITDRYKKYDNLKKVSGYFIRIEITKIGISRDFPLMSYVVDGVRQFENKIGTIYTNKVMLEDMIKFQKIEFKILDGYYFNSGHNNRINKVIKHLYTERAKFKKDENPIQLVYKLLMNSGYGKTLLKPISTMERVFKNKEEAMKYIHYNHNNVLVASQIHNSKKFIVKSKKSIDKHFNICHVGSDILGWSKRIMNRIMCLAEDNDIKIYYQDTDSLHFKVRDKAKLDKLYRRLYEKDLYGEDLGQISSDFKIKGCADVSSKTFLGISKKCYFDKIQGIDKTTGEVKTSIHYRLKGVPHTCIKYQADKQFKGDIESLYRALYKGQKITFDLLEGGTKCSFQKYSDLSIGSRNKFERVIQFE